jgi:hypothetical protein
MKSSKAWSVWYDVLCLVSDCKNTKYDFFWIFLQDRRLKNVVFSRLTPLPAAQNPPGFVVLTFASKH